MNFVKSKHQYLILSPTYTGTFTGDGGSVTCSATVYISSPPPVPTCSMTASPSSIITGSNSSISWSSSNANSAYISPTIGSVGTSGTRTVSPSSTTTYTGTFTGDGGSITCSATVYVSSPPPLPSCTLTADPTSIQNGNSSDLSWIASNATLATIDQTIGSVDPVSGTETVSPTTTTIYTMTVTGAGGTSTCAATVTVSDIPLLPSCTLTADPTSIQTGNSSDLSWIASNATLATIDQTIGSVDPVSGTETVSPATTTIYTMTVTGAGGTSTCAATVTVSDTPPLPSCTLNVDPSTISKGDSSTLTWTTSNVTSGMIDNGIGSVNLTGSTSVSPNDATTYTANFTGPYGDATCSVSLSVGGGGGGGGNPPTVTLGSIYSVPNVEPSFIYLDQVPYTGLLGKDILVRKIFFMVN